MCIGITLLSIKSGRRIPDGLFLPYPALNLRMDVYSPSLIEAITDEIVPFSFLTLCLTAYNEDQERTKTDPLISPIVMSDEILKLFPPIRMAVGTNDPVHDECWRMLHRLVSLDKDVKLHVWKDMIHGILNFDMFLGMPVALDCVKDGCELLKELIKA